jgi:hypothetical protein
VYLTGNVELIGGGSVRYDRLGYGIPLSDSTWIKCFSIVM